MAPAIRFRSVIALLGAFPVLAGVDLDVARGEIVLLEGANGAGKTSLLRACAGLLQVVSGEAEVLGCDLLEDRRTVRRRLGLLGHATSLYDDLTVEDNVRFATRASRGRSDAVARALESLGLTGRLPATPVGRLSAGQRRRTALAVLVARDPELWLLDEPHAGLDAEHRERLDGLVRDAAGRGATVVIASHEHDRAAGVAGRVVTMAGGQAAATGPAARAVGSGARDPDRPAEPASLNSTTTTTAVRPAGPGSGSGAGVSDPDRAAEPADIDRAAGAAELAGAPVAHFPSEPAHVA